MFGNTSGFSFISFLNFRLVFLFMILLVEKDFPSVAETTKVLRFHLLRLNFFRIRDIIE
jgi:hypothetical protein